MKDENSIYDILIYTIVGLRQNLSKNYFSHGGLPVGCVKTWSICGSTHHLLNAFLWSVMNASVTYFPGFIYVISKIIMTLLCNVFSALKGIRVYV